MKKRAIVTAGILGLFLLGFATPTLAGDKEVTVTGEGKCAKCILKEGEKCQTVIQTKEEGKKVTYYVADNEASKKFSESEDLCKEGKKVKATGTVKEVDGKKVLTVSKIAMAK